VTKEKEWEPSGRQKALIIVIAIVSCLTCLGFMIDITMHERDYSGELQFTTLEELEDFVVAADEKRMVIQDLSKQSPLTVEFTGYKDIRNMGDWTYSEPKVDSMCWANRVVFLPLLTVMAPLAAALGALVLICLYEGTKETVIRRGGST